MAWIKIGAARSIHSHAAPRLALAIASKRPLVGLDGEVAPPVERVRILFDKEVPPMLRTTVEGVLASNPVCHVVEPSDKQASLEGQLAEISPDMLIVMHPAQDNGPGRFVRLHLSSPALRILAVTPRDGRAFIHWLKPHVMEIGELSSESLRAALSQTRSTLQMEA